MMFSNLYYVRSTCQYLKWRRWEPTNRVLRFTFLPRKPAHCRKLARLSFKLACFRRQPLQESNVRRIPLTVDLAKRWSNIHLDSNFRVPKPPTGALAREQAASLLIYFYHFLETLGSYKGDLLIDFIKHEPEGRAFCKIIPLGLYLPTD